MTRSRSLASLPLCVLLVSLCLPANAHLLPDGEAVWTFETAYDYGSVTFDPQSVGGTGGSLSVTSRSTGASLTLPASPVAVYDDGHGSAYFLAFANLTVADFNTQFPYDYLSAGSPPWVSLYLSDPNGVIFDTGGAAGYHDPPADPPRLGLFAVAQLRFFAEEVDPANPNLVGPVEYDFNLTALPEPSPAALAVLALGLVLAKNRRAPEA